jgi:hypothetical protein
MFLAMGALAACTNGSYSGTEGWQRWVPSGLRPCAVHWWASAANQL